jgi:hypothetical protein
MQKFFAGPLLIGFVRLPDVPKVPPLYAPAGLYQVILPESLSAKTVPDESFRDWEHDDIQAQKNLH